MVYDMFKKGQSTIMKTFLVCFGTDKVVVNCMTITEARILTMADRIKMGKPYSITGINEIKKDPQINMVTS